MTSLMIGGVIAYVLLLWSIGSDIKRAKEEKK